MTTPYGGNFANTDNSVAAKLSLDIPADSVTTLKELALYTGSLAENLQAAARFSGEYMSYLTQLPQLQRQMNDANKEALQTMRDMQTVQDSMRMSQMFPSSQQMGPTSQYYNNMLFNRGGNESSYAGSAPRGTSDAPVQPIGSSDQTQRDSSVNNYIQSMGATPGSNLNLFGNPLNNIRNNIPYGAINGLPIGHTYQQENSGSPGTQSVRDEEIKRYIGVSKRDAETGRHRSSNKASDRHRSSDNEDDTKEEDEEGTHKNQRTHAPIAKTSRSGVTNTLKNAMTEFSNISNNVLSTGQAGNTPLAGRASLISNTLQSVGNLSPALKFAGAAGLGIGAAGLAFNAVQNVGEDIQQYRTQDVRGNSFSKGMGIQKDIMLMSLNPLISTEQSRSIIMGALNEGYQGKQYDNAVEFIKKNLVDMNIDIGTSMQLLKTNVDIGGQSISNLSTHLANLQSISAAGGGQTTTQEAAGITKTSEFLRSQGADISKSSGTIMSANNLFNQPNADGSKNTLAGYGQKFLNTGWSTTALQGKLRSRFSPNSTAYSVIADLDESNQLGTDTEILINEFVAQAKTEGTKRLTQQDFFHNMQNYFGVEDIGKSNEVYEKYLSASAAGTTPMKQGNDYSKKVLGSFVGSGSNVVDASTLLTFNQWKKESGNAGKTESDWKNYLTKGKGGEPDLQDTGFMNMIKTNANLVVVDETGKKLIANVKDLNQIIGLANGSYHLARTTVDMKFLHREDDGTISKLNEGNVVTDQFSNQLDGRYAKMAAKLQDDINNPKNPLKTNALTFDSYGNVSEIDNANTAVADLPSAAGAAPSSDTPGSSGGSGKGVRISDYLKSGSYTAPIPDQNSNPFIDLSPDAKRMFILSGLLPGSVLTDTNSTSSNSGYNGTTKNSSPPGNPGSRGKSVAW